MIFCHFFVPCNLQAEMPIQNPWQVAEDGDLLKMMSADGVRLSDRASDFDRFAAAIPYLSVGTNRDRFAAKCRKIGYRLPQLIGNASALWQSMCDFLEDHPITVGQFRYGKSGADAIRYADDSELISSFADENPEKALLMQLEQFRQNGIKIIRTDLPAEYRFGLPDAPGSLRDFGKRESDAVIQTEQYRLLADACKKSGTVWQIVTGATPVRNTRLEHISPTPPVVALPEGHYSQLALLFDYLTVRDGMAVTLLCPKTCADAESALALAAVFSPIFLGVQTPVLPSFPPHRTVLRYDEAAPAVFCENQRTAFTRYDYGITPKALCHENQKSMFTLARKIRNGDIT